MKKVCFFLACLILAAPACADVAEPVLLENAPDFVVGDKSSLTPEQRQANANAVQLMLTKARDERRPLVLPDGVIAVDATAARRQLWLWPGVELRSAGKTVIQFGPDSLGGPGFDHPNFGWFLLRVPARSGTVEIGAGITLQAPDTDPALWTGVATPQAFSVDGVQGGSGIRRRITWKDARIEGAWAQAITLPGDAAGLSGIRTELDLDRPRLNVYGGGISAFGVDKKVRIRDLTAVTQSSCIYFHQGVEVDVDGADITVGGGFAGGSTCVLDKGTKSVGAAPGRYANMVLRASGPGVTGMELDHQANRRVSDVEFDASLYAGLRVRGKAQTVNCVFRCPTAYAGFGGGSGDAPLITSIGDRFIGVRSVWPSVVVPGSEVRWYGATVVTESADTLFTLDLNPDAALMRMRLYQCRIRAGDVRSVFGPRLGDWELVDCDISVRSATHGIFGGGCDGGGSMRVKGGRAEGGPLFYSGASEDAKARVRFLP